jgi:hypothetical protein
MFRSFRCALASASRQWPPGAKTKSCLLAKRTRPPIGRAARAHVRAGALPRITSAALGLGAPGTRSRQKMGPEGRWRGPRPMSAGGGCATGRHNALFAGTGSRCWAAAAAAAAAEEEKTAVLAACMQQRVEGAGRKWRARRRTVGCGIVF